MSSTIGALVSAIILPLLVQYGFSSSCSNEIVGISAPILVSLPGIVWAWKERVKRGDVNWYGGRVK